MHTLNIIYKVKLESSRNPLFHTRLTAERNTNSIRSAKEIVRQWGYLTTVTDGNGTIISVGVVIARFLVILDLDEKEF